MGQQEMQVLADRLINDPALRAGDWKQVGDEELATRVSKGTRTGMPASG